MPASDQRPDRVVIAAALAIAAATAVRLWLASRLGLAPDEAYYWQWSCSPALTYPDHPPLVAWLIHLGTALAGPTALGVRLASVLCGAAAALLVYRIARALALEPPLAAASAVLASLMPAPAAASLLATPDTALGLCWLCAALALIRLARAPTPGQWYLLGAALGLGLLAKHSALLLLPAAIAATLLSPALRRQLRTPHPWLGLALALVIAAPYLNAEIAAGLPSISLQLAHLSGDLPASQEPAALAIPLRLAAVLGGQIGLLTPLVALFAIALLVRRRPLTSGWHVSALLWLLPLAATCLAALAVHPEQNWAALGHPLAAVMAVGVLAQTNRPDQRSRLRPWLAILLLTAAAVTLALHVHALRPFLPLPADRDPVARLHGWAGLSAVREHASRADAILCDNYGLAAELAWQLRHRSDVPPIAGADRAPVLPAGDWLLLDERGDWSAASLSPGCERIDPVAEVHLARADGDVVRTVIVARGVDCRAVDERESSSPRAR
jgi:4-amino-4-deoxy-L-arabinose transferase-like glycosyltransferase